MRRWCRSQHGLGATTAALSAIEPSPQRALALAITSSSPLDLWAEVRIVAALWDEIQRRRVEPGPFVDSVTLSGVRRLQ